ncbi:hypothetical protein [Pseudomonas sp.]|uniref:hypothetical protein n=1 Tax=Pseudomonas sp. TaxID=306 RepID=UPI00258CD11D|nr:hypothetical protein [Pseudomonas sp.]
MSHFAVMVIGPNVEQQLAPYHEFECTGVVDQYVQTIDKLDELRAEYETDTRSMKRGPGGELLPSYDDAFYRDPTPEEKDKIGMGSGFGGGISWTSKDWGDGLGYRAKVRFTPEGWEDVDVPVKDVMTLVEFIKYQNHEDFPILQEDDVPDLEDRDGCKWGWARINAAGEVIEYTLRTNPNAQWDWWQLGGRYSGFLKLKEGAGAIAEKGRKGLMGSCMNDGPSWVDSVVKSAIDFDGMREKDGNEAASRWDKAAAAKVAAGFAADATWDSWDTVRERHPGAIDAARDEYHAQPVMKAVKVALDNPFRGVDDLLVSREQFIQEARDRALVTYALVKDGQWCAKGEMGWWGMSSDDMPQEEWNRKVNELIDSLPDDTLITIVDCHI